VKPDRATAGDDYEKQMAEYYRKEADKLLKKYSGTSVAEKILEVTEGKFVRKEAESRIDV